MNRRANTTFGQLGADNLEDGSAGSELARRRNLQIVMRRRASTAFGQLDADNLENGRADPILVRRRLKPNDVMRRNTEPSGTSDSASFEPLEQLECFSPQVQRQRSWDRQRRLSKTYSRRPPQPAPSLRSASASAAVLVTTVLCWIAYCGESIAASLIGALLPSLAERCGYATAELTVLVPTFNAGGAVGSALGGVMFDAFNQGSEQQRYGMVPAKVLKLLSTLLLAIALCNVPIAIAPLGRRTLAGFCFLHGVFNGAFRMGANWIMMRLHPPSTAPPYLLAMHFCSGVGRFLAGCLGVLYADAEHLVQAVWLVVGYIAVVAVVVGIVAGRSGTRRSDAGAVDAKQLGHLVDSPGSSSDQDDIEEDLKASSRFVVLLASSAFLLVGVQNSFQYLITTFAVAASPPLTFTTPAKAAELSAAYGLAFAIGRLLSVGLSVRFSPSVLMQGSATVLCMALATAALMPSACSMWLVIAMATGISTATVFPGTINYARSRLGALRGGTMSFFMLSATAGGVVLPKVAASIQPELMMQMLFASSLGGFVMFGLAETSLSPQKE